MSLISFTRTVVRRNTLLVFVFCIINLRCGNDVSAEISNSQGSMHSCLPSCGTCKHPVECIQKGTRSQNCEAGERCFQICAEDDCTLTCEQSQKCSQQCYGKKCSATCRNNNENCNQECQSGDCVMKCDSRKCYQECRADSCEATCAEGVEECTQMCEAGDCSFSCDAKSCRKLYSTLREGSEKPVVWHIVVSLIGGIIFAVILVYIIWCSCRKIKA